MLMAMDGVVENHHLWTSQFRSEESQKYKFDELFASDALLLGRITYQGLAAAWPGATGAYGERINSMPKYVPTTTLQEAEWNATLIKDPRDAQRVLPQQQSGLRAFFIASLFRGGGVKVTVTSRKVEPEERREPSSDLCIGK